MGDVRRDHHVVTKAYLEHWGRPGEAGEKSISLCDLKNRWRRNVSAKDVCVRRDFNILRSQDELDDSLERQWGTVVESRSLPLIRSIEGPDDLDTAREGAVKAFAAMHVARSLPMLHLFNRSWDARVRNNLEQADFERLRQSFVNDFGRDPEVGEIRAIWLEAADRRRHTNETFVEIVVETYKKLLELLQPKYVQFGRPIGQRARFATSDNPVVFVNWPRVGIHNGLGIREARQIWMPLRPDLIVHFTSEPEAPEDVPQFAVKRMNWEMRRNAIRFLVMHPNDSFNDVFPFDPWFV